MTTPILGMTELEDSQSQPHVPINAAFRALEVASCLVRVADKDLSTPPVSPQEGDRYIVAGSPTDEWVGHDLQIAYYSGGWQFLVAETGWLAYVADEDSYYQFVAGSPTGWVLWATGVEGPEPEPQPYDIGAQLAGAPTASLVILRFKYPRAIAYPAGLTNSQGVSEVAATAQTDFDIKKNGSSIGTMRFAAAGTSATFIMASDQSFAQGDVMTVIAPASPDATLAGISFTLAGTR